ncbi:hypothetical protein JCM18750_00540 [Halostagnicola bangensis]
MGSATIFGATVAVGQENEVDDEIELEGRTSGWIGESPDEIEGERNPTLELVEGEEYTLTWENGDGAGHNFVIEDEEGEEEFVQTDVISGTGETQAVEFTAEEGMAEYFCGPHPQSMRGEIEFVDEDEEPEEEIEDDPDEIIGDGPTVGLETVADGLSAPVSLQVANEEEDRRFVVDQTGQIHVLGEDGVEDEPFLDIEDRMVDLDEGFDERGLLGLAFHPEFEENGRFFVRYSAPPDEEEIPGDDVPEAFDHTDVLAEFEAGGGLEEGDPDSERIILRIPQPQFNHNAGPIAFGPNDGYLYVATGDGGGQNDADPGHVEDWYDENEGGNGQDTEENLLGGILRIDVDDGNGANDEADGEAQADEDDENANEEDADEANGEEANVDGEETDEENANDDRAYGIPDDNPFAEGQDLEGEGLEEYYAWGMRNPWGMSFTEDGELLAADVAQNNFNQINHVESGGNYGWNVREGRHCFSTDSPEDPPEECPLETPEDVRGGESLLEPVIEYPQHPDDLAYDEDVDRGEEEADERIGTAVVGGYTYEGDEVTDLEDTYVFGDWSQDGEGPGTLFLARQPDDWPEDVDDEADELEDMFVDPPDEDEDDGADEDDEDELEDMFVDPPNEDDEDDDEADDDEADEEDEEEELGVWQIEELSVEGDGDVVEDGELNHLVYGFGRDDDGEVYVLTSNTSTIEGEGQVHRIVPGEDDEETEDDEDNDEVEAETDNGEDNADTDENAPSETGDDGNESD